MATIANTQHQQHLHVRNERGGVRRAKSLLLLLLLLIYFWNLLVSRSRHVMNDTKEKEESARDTKLAHATIKLDE